MFTDAAPLLGQSEIVRPGVVEQQERADMYASVLYEKSE
jgi:hypothetical protein